MEILPLREGRVLGRHGLYGLLLGLARGVQAHVGATGVGVTFGGLRGAPALACA